MQQLEPITVNIGKNHSSLGNKKVQHMEQKKKQQEQDVGEVIFWNN
jgi:hypothetical protein